MKKFYNDLDILLCSVSLVHMYKYVLQVPLKTIKKFWFSLQIEKTKASSKLHCLWNKLITSQEIIKFLGNLLVIFAAEKY